jgi:hypothetical protein
MSITRRWYAYTGTPGSELSAGSYLPTDLKPTCFEGSPTICAIYARSDPQRYGLTPGPLSMNLVRYIATAKATSLAQPVGIGVKKYIYTYPGL